MNGGDSALAINQEGGRQGIDAAVELRRVIVADQNPVIHLQTREKRLDDFPALIVHGDADNGEPFSLMLPLKLLEPGNFDFARTTPGGPEIQEHDFAAVVHEVDELAVRIFEGKIRRFVPLFVGFNGSQIYRALRPGMAKEVAQRADNCAHYGNGSDETECGHSLPSSPYIIRAKERLSRCPGTTRGAVREISVPG